MRRSVTVFALILVALSASALRAAVPSSGDTKVCLQGNSGDTVEACTALIETQKFTGTALAEIYFRRGSAYLKIRRFDSALRDFDSAMAIAPNNPAVLSARGEAHEYLNQKDQALSDFSAAIALLPSNSALFVLRGILRLSLNDYDAAIADLDNALALEPDDAWAYQGRGLAYLRQGQYDKAVQDEDQAIKLKPDLQGALLARGDAKQELGQYEASVQDEDALLKLAPGNSVALNSRCFALAKWNNKLDQALADCTKALAISPSNPGIMDSLGLVYFRMGDLAQAATQYDAALAADPKAASSLFMRGIIKLKRGDASGSADIAAAETLDGLVAGRYARAGVTPPGQ